MLKKIAIVCAISVVALTSHAQTTQGKKDQIARILKIQQPGIEGMARAVAERPAVELLTAAGQALPSRIAEDKREAVAKEIQADAKKYADEAGPLVQARALKLAPLTIGTLLEQKFTEDELKQLAGMLESPVLNRFQGLTNEMQTALLQRLMPEVRPLLEPKLKALDQGFAKRLGVTAPPAGAVGTAPAKK